MHSGGPRAHEAAPGRTKGVLCGAHEDYVHKVAKDVARKDKGRVGRCPEGQRARGLAPEKITGVLTGGSRKDGRCVDPRP